MRCNFCRCKIRPDERHRLSMVHWNDTPVCFVAKRPVRNLLLSPRLHAALSWTACLVSFATGHDLAALAFAWASVASVISILKS